MRFPIETVLALEDVPVPAPEGTARSVGVCDCGCPGATARSVGVCDCGWVSVTVGD